MLDSRKARHRCSVQSRGRDSACDPRSGLSVLRRTYHASWTRRWFYANEQVPGIAVPGLVFAELRGVGGARTSRSGGAIMESISTVSLRDVIETYGAEAVNAMLAHDRHRIDEEGEIYWMLRRALRSYLN